MPYFLRVRQPTGIIVGIQFTPKPDALADQELLRHIEVPGEWFAKLFTDLRMRHRYVEATRDILTEVDPPAE